MNNNRATDRSTAQCTRQHTDQDELNKNSIRNIEPIAPTLLIILVIID